MANYASVKRRPTVEAKPSPGTLAHNQRLAKNIDLLPEEHRLPNYHLCKLSNVTKVFNSWEVENEKRYQEINGRKLRTDAHRLESLAIILSEEQVGKCNPDDIWVKALEFKSWFEQRYKTKVRTMDWHRDEGYINEEDEVIRNDHIHIEYDNVNSDGKMVRKLFSKGDLIGFQDKIAEIYKPLGFKRGEDTTKKSRSDQPKIGLGQREHKKQKIIETKAKKEPLAKIKDLNAMNKKLREELEALKAKREAYAALEEEIKQLKQRIKNKELTEAELNKKIEELSNTIKTKNDLIGQAEDLLFDQEDKIDKLETKIEELENKEPEKVEVEKIVYKEDTTRINTLETEISTYKQTISNKETQISNLKTQNQALNEKIATLPSPSTLEDLNTLKKDFEEKDKEYWELYPLAYDDNHIIQEVDDYGMFHDRVPSYKERYESSEKEKETLKSKFDDKKNQVKNLKEGYSKIETKVFGKDEDRSVEEIVKGVSTLATILSNVSKYLNLGMGKIMQLFEKDVPDQVAVQKEQPNKYKSLLTPDKENNSSPGIKPMKP